ncbi:WecB/TagA/CpsF family glycosyltransferase [Prevotella copri]|nr:WecB/TagA/CpsF family glycosyltransferase [Segatella copri]
MEKYFNINYEFSPREVGRRIDEQLSKNESDYICVADGVILNNANRKPDYLKIVNGGMFAICDSGYVPLYIKWLYGKRYPQYCGSQIFKDLVSSQKYRMFFMGTNQRTLDGLKENLKAMNPKVENMSEDGADIIWVALGAPKQEIFMSKLKPYLKRGVMIAVGAAFKFYSGQDEKRAPKWMLDAHLEFVYRIFCDPKKQLKRCGWIVVTLPMLLYQEWKRKRFMQL